MKSYFIVLLILFSTSFIIFQSCQKNKSNSYETSTEEDVAPATSSDWISIFDGETFEGWHGYNKDEVGPAWQISDGAMYLDKSKGEAGDIVTDQEYENYEFALEWKISECGNSGIFFNVVESSEYKTPWLTGPEMQVLDNKCHPDAKIETHRAGDLYDMIETSVVNVKPAGEWNSIRIRSDNGDMTFYQNEVEVVKFKMHDDNWNKMVAESKFNSMPAFGKARKGRLGLQDHGDMVWFRNIRIKVL